MPMSSHKTRELITPMHILAGYDEPIRGLAEQLRRLVQQTVPVIERTYAGWRGLGYHRPLPHGGYFCGIYPRRDAVRLLFEWGAQLPDEDGLLRGDGVRTRYVELRPGLPIPEAALRRLIQVAAERCPT